MSYELKSFGMHLSHGNEFCGMMFSMPLFFVYSTEILSGAVWATPLRHGTVSWWCVSSVFLGHALSLSQEYA